MATFNESLAAQLWAAALKVADTAASIVGDLGPNESLRVIISLRTDDEMMRLPRLQIKREIIPTKAVREKIRTAKENAAARRTEENRRELGLDEIRER